MQNKKREEQKACPKEEHPYLRDQLLFPSDRAYINIVNVSKNQLVLSG